MIAITLGPQQIAFAEMIGAARDSAALYRARRPKNGLAVDRVEGLDISVLGALAEMAAWKYMRPIKWHAFAHTITGLPDLGERIEVKGVTGVRNPTIIVPPYVGGAMPSRDWAYLLIDGTDHPTYRLLGWLWGHQFLDAAHWDTRLPRPAWRGLPPYHSPIGLRTLARMGRV